MNALDFLHISGICESKSDARRSIKANRISLDFKKLTDEKVDISAVLEDGDSLESIDAGSWLSEMSTNKSKPTSFPELLLFRLAKKFNTLNVKKIDEVADAVMSEIFVVENGKKNFSIVRVNRKEIEFSK
jgi:hypothetical protein